MKKFLSLILCLVLALSLGASCFADSIYVPDSNFYSLHYGECDLHDRGYVAAEGSCAQKSPEDASLSFKLKENLVYNVSVTYTDGKGIVWGCIEEDNKVSGKNRADPL